MNAAQTTPKPQRLAALNNRGETPHGRMHSFVVRKLRWLLPIVALGIVLVLLVWPRIQNELENLRFKVAPLDKAVLELAATETRLLSANFSSVDTQGRPYTVLADHAIQQNSNPDLIALKAPKAKLQNTPDTHLDISSNTGTMNQVTNWLELNDNVVLTRSDGTTLTTTILHINISTQDANTDQPIKITGPQIQLDAQSMTTTNGSENIVFTGPATLILQQTPKGGS